MPIVRRFERNGRLTFSDNVVRGLYEREARYALL
jgi:hypothetical protein